MIVNVIEFLILKIDSQHLCADGLQLLEPLGAVTIVSTFGNPKIMILSTGSREYDTRFASSGPNAPRSKSTIKYQNPALPI